jgi:uncharacterized membrane protein
MHEIQPRNDQGKFLAILAHASPFLGLPLWILPLVMRDDPFALYHAKQAGVVGIAFYLTFFGIIAFSVVTCGIGSFAVPLIFVWYIPAILGLLSALNGKCEPIPVLGDFAERLFGSITLKDGA